MTETGAGLARLLESEGDERLLVHVGESPEPDQNRVVAEVQAAASTANFSLFLTGGAMRDMLGGFQIRDLDFTVEGNAPKLAKTLTAKAGARVLTLDEHRHTMELVFPGGVTAEIGMSRRERYPKVGGRPQVTPGTIQEDLRRRDFTVNAIALSLNRASRGLLLDPLNGLADLGRKELRTLFPTAFYDDPVRLLRLLRLRLRLGYAVEEKTQSQYENARAAKVEAHISRRALCEELKQIAAEPNPSEVVTALAQEGFLALFSPALTEAKMNLAGLVKLEKTRRVMPPDALTTAANWGPFLRPDGKVEFEGTPGSRQADRDAKERSGRLAEAAASREEARGGAEVRAIEEAFADFRSAGQNAGR